MKLELESPRVARVFTPSGSARLVVERPEEMTARIDAYAAALAKTAKRMPKPALRDRGGCLYRHAVYGFRLHLPAHLAPEFPGIASNAFGAAYGQQVQYIEIGSRVRLRVDHQARTLHGEVPASWLVDLNGPDAVDETDEPHDTLTGDLLAA